MPPCVLGGEFLRAPLAVPIRPARGTHLNVTPRAGVDIVVVVPLGAARWANDLPAATAVRAPMGGKVKPLGDYAGASAVWADRHNDSYLLLSTASTMHAAIVRSLQNSGTAPHE